MNIGLIDNELCSRKNHSFPNLAIMKLSSYYKKQGHNVKLINFDEIDPNSLFVSKFDKVFISKVFVDTFTPDWIDKLDFIKKGGSGFFYDKAEPLPYDIEHSFPDYNIYNSIPSCKHSYYKDYSIGFITRGCIRQCPFCINKNTKTVQFNADINEFYDKNRPYIMLLDDNITAYKGFYDIFDKLDNLGTPFVFKQGMDFRLLNNKKMQRLWSANYLSSDRNKQKKGARVYHFAFDNIGDYDLIEKRLKEYYYNKPYAFKVFFYVLIGFDRENKYDYSFFKKDVSDLLKRVELLFKYNAYPYVMIHENINKSPFSNILKTLKNILNNPLYITNKSIKDALIQSKLYYCIKWLEDNEPWFLDLTFNSKLYKR